MSTETSDVDALDRLDWPGLAAQLDADGVATTPPLLTAGQCAEVISWFGRDGLFRSTVVMARHAFGLGSYRYFADPLPGLVGELRERLYPPMAAIANRWAALLGEHEYPEELAALHARCAQLGQHRPTPLLLRYGKGGYNCLHQDLYGELAFPLQILIMLNTPEVDFTGGESVFVEQRPRQQSRPVVVRPGLGQAVIFPVRHRPVPGVRGYRKLTLRHGVAAVHTGNRNVLGIIFHNAR